MHDPINTGLTRMAGGRGGSLVRSSLGVHHVENERGEARRDGRTCLVRPNSQARAGTGEKQTFLVQLTTNEINTFIQSMYVWSSHTAEYGSTG